MRYSFCSRQPSSTQAFHLRPNTVSAEIKKQSESVCKRKGSGTRREYEITIEKDDVVWTDGISRCCSGEIKAIGWAGGARGRYHAGRAGRGGWLPRCDRPAEVCAVPRGHHTSLCARLRRIPRAPLHPLMYRALTVRVGRTRGRLSDGNHFMFHYILSFRCLSTWLFGVSEGHTSSMNSKFSSCSTVSM